MKYTEAQLRFDEIGQRLIEQDIKYYTRSYDNLTKLDIRSSGHLFHFNTFIKAYRDWTLSGFTIELLDLLEQELESGNFNELFTVKKLNLDANNFNSIPTLPVNINILSIRRNKLETLEIKNCPSSLLLVYCDNNLSDNIIKNTANDNIIYSLNNIRYLNGEFKSYIEHRLYYNKKFYHSFETLLLENHNILENFKIVKFYDR